MLKDGSFSGTGNGHFIKLYHMKLVKHVADVIDNRYAESVCNIYSVLEDAGVTLALDVLLLS